MEPERGNKIQPQRIFLIRHARPEVPDGGRYTAAAARRYIADYDAAHVAQFVLAHEAIPYQQVSKVYCSTLRRSQLTAKAIFGEKVQLQIVHDFREFERRIFSLPWLRLPISLWLVSARILWFLGLNSRGIETFRQARQRARKCAELLAQDAQINRTTVLVAHGLLNNFIKWELRRMGWKTISSDGHAFLSVTLLEL